LAELAETIIPKTDTPGAKDISAHLFALMMVDDCYKKEDQQKFLAGLKAFEAETKKQFNKSFTDCSQAERETLLTELDAKKAGNADLEYFYGTTKRLTVQAYTTSKFYLTNIQVYKLVPGKYYGCVPIKKAS
jgi:Gluconate 2-dehydrogenase subunit 3